MYNTYLAHHGVKGMKWGIRRFQNPDGSLTAEGKKRYEVNEKGKMSRYGKKIYSRDKYISKEIDYQNNKINSLNKTRKAYEDSYNKMLKEKNSSIKELMQRGTSKKDAEAAFKEVLTRRKEEAGWYKYQADKMIDYNKKLQDLDISNMNKWQITKYYHDLGNVTLSEINKYGANLDKNRYERAQRLGINV